MKNTLISLLITFIAFTTKAQSAFDNKTEVRSSDGTVYTIKKLEPTGQSLRVQSSQNSLASEMAKYPDARSELGRTTQFYSNHFTTPLNKLFNKEKLLSFRNTRLKFFAIADRSGTIREVYFYISKGTTITVEDLRRIELMIKQEKMYFFKYQKTDRRGQSYSQIRGATIDDIPEFNGIQYFAINTLIDFDYAYRAVMRIRDPGSRPSIGEPTGPDTIWLVPVTR